MIRRKWGHVLKDEKFNDTMRRAGLTMPRIIKFFVFEYRKQNCVTFDLKAKKFDCRVPVGRGSRTGSSMADEYRKQTWVTVASVAEKIDGRVRVLVGRGGRRRSNMTDEYRKQVGWRVPVRRGSRSGTTSR